MKPNQPKNSSFSLCHLLILPASCLFLTGCFQTGGEQLVGSKPAATTRIAYNQKQVARGSAVQQGFSPEDVHLAWGEPSKRTVHQTQDGPQEQWTYVKTHHGGHGGGYYGVARGWKETKKGSRYDSDTFYPAPHTAETLGGTASTDVPVKRVVFQDGRVVSYETRHQDTSES